MKDYSVQLPCMEEYDASQSSRIMSRDEVRQVDRWAIEQMGVPGVVLMENAGRSCAELIREKLIGVGKPRVCIFCGTGNNGGDGYVIARHLCACSVPVRAWGETPYGVTTNEVCVVVCGPREKIAGDARINLDILERLGQAIAWLNPSDRDAAQSVRDAAAGAHLIVDALFGTGLQGELRAEYRTIIEAINGLGIPILAVDIPSGLDCDTGESLGAVVRATWTMTFVAVKKGFAAYPQSRDYTGKVYVAPIGVEPP
jgi:NAD(P)H-hydrate epimerase